MLNQERVILMTKMASYEANQGKINIAIANYFRGDYVWMQILKSVICATLAFGAVVGLYIFYDFEAFILNIYKIDLFEFGKDMLIKYLAVVGLYSIISYAVYAARYAKAKNSLKLYFNHLRRLSAMYER